MIHAFYPDGRTWCGARAAKGDRVTAVRWRRLCPVCVAVLTQYTRSNRK